MLDFLKKIGPQVIRMGLALKRAAIAVGFFLKTPSGAAVTLMSILTIASAVTLSVRLYEFVRVDDREVILKTGLEDQIDLFAVTYENESGEITVAGADGVKVVAPGTSVEYTLRLRNKDNTAIDYSLTTAMEYLSEYDLPIQVRLISPDEQYVLGTATEWVPLSALNGVSLQDTLIMGESAEYIFQWKWDYEGDDAYDTLLGNSPEPIEVQVGFDVTASANTVIGINGGFVESGMSEIVFSSVSIIILGSAITILAVPMIQKAVVGKKGPKGHAPHKSDRK